MPEGVLGMASPARPTAGPRRMTHAVGHWTRLVLMDGAGHFLWRNNPPGGTWYADHPMDALSWANEAEALDWLYDQSDNARRRLSDGGWRLVELAIAGAIFVGPVPAVAEAVCECECEGVADA